ncbi:MAG: amino acid adenylation domain-containing protein, partial [bacterium]|nr:amino acid adenylation domain-containing protein [bacterium]
WQNRFFAGEKIKKQEQYWLRLYGDTRGIPRLQLPTDYKRPEIFSFAGDTYHFTVDRETSSAFKELAVKHGATLYMNSLAALNVLLYKYTGQTDIIIGTGVAGRPHIDLERIIGMFVNILAMRNQPQGEKTYESFLKEVINQSANAFENQDIQWEELVSRLNIQRDTSRNPLFDVSMVVQNFSQSGKGVRKTLVDNTSPPVKYNHNNSKFDLTFFIEEYDEDVYINIEYYRAIFRLETVQRMAGHFKNIIKTVIRDPNRKLKDIGIISGEEKRQLLYEFNDTEADYPLDKTIHQLFEEQVEQTPDNIAVAGAGAGDESNLRHPVHLTYRELSNQSCRLAGLLKEKGVQTNSLVAIMADRCMEMIIGILGILYAGGAYLPIAPDYPAQRIGFMLKDSGAKLLVSTNSLAQEVKKLKRSGVNREIVTIFINPMEHLPNSSYHDQLLNFPASGPASLAYVIYTSGSTGRPKGVMLRHQGICSLNVLYKEEFKVDERDRVVQFANSSFDASVSEMIMALLNGAALVLVGKDIIGDYEEFSDYVTRQGVTIATLPPAYANYLDPVKVKSLRILVTAGSASSPYLVDKWSHQLQYINAYGPTETTICTTVWYADGRTGPPDTVPIGKPISNTRIYMLDTNSAHIQPIGVAGELCVAGVSLARGYLNRPELTAERFVNYKSQIPNYKFQITNKTSPFPAPSAVKIKLYKTGDLARWLPDGNIEFIGRIDHQIQILGVRIEPQEIESVLLDHADIKEAAVVA